MTEQPPKPTNSDPTKSDPNRVVCSCKLVTQNEIVDAIKSGHSTFIALRMKLSVTTGCGSCLIEVDRLLEEHRSTDQDTSF